MTEVKYPSSLIVPHNTITRNMRNIRYVIRMIKALLPVRSVIIICVKTIM